MASSSPLRSFTIDRTLLNDHGIVRTRPQAKKPFALITTKNHPTLPLAIHNYNARAFMGSVLDELAMAARTLVTESSTSKVASRSFSKFFNYDENFAYKPTGKEYTFSIEEKIDGSIISLFYYGKEWMMVSRSSFEGPHIQAARNILDSQYPAILNKLDQDKTYIFELVDPAMPIKIVYAKSDLVLLSIISKDGQEPPLDFDWTALPFPRPRLHKVSKVDPRLLSKLNKTNEEGFVIKFWQSPDDRFPQRVKVKFESYLEITGGLPRRGSSSLELHDNTSVTSPPSNARILEIYLNRRLKIQHFKADLVSSKMAERKEEYLQSMENLADDYGGEDWLRKIEEVWNKIDINVNMQEDEWRTDLASLKREGYKPNVANAAPHVAKQKFEKQMKKNHHFDESYRAALFSWFVGEPPSKQVSLLVKNMVLPDYLRSTESIR